MGYIKEEKERSLKQVNIYKPSEISRFFSCLEPAGIDYETMMYYNVLRKKVEPWLSPLE